MGYTTNFKGELKFTKELKASELAKLSSMLGEDCREHPEWDYEGPLYYIDLELLEDFSGIKWDGSEKTYSMTSMVNLIIREMRKHHLILVCTANFWHKARILTIGGN